MVSLVAAQYIWLVSSNRQVHKWSQYPNSGTDVQGNLRRRACKPARRRRSLSRSHNLKEEKKEEEKMEEQKKEEEKHSS